MQLRSAVRRQQWRLFGLLFLIYLTVDLLLTSPIAMTLTNGDEPHYLLMVHSLLYDHDLILENNYTQQDYRHFFDGDVLDPHLFPLGGRMVPAHYLAGLPLLLVLPYSLAGRMGVLILLSAVMALGLVSLYPVLRTYVAPRLAAATILFCGLTYPVLVYSHQIYPDTVAFALVALVLSQIIPLVAPSIIEQTLRQQAVIVGLALGLLPHFHLRFGLLAVTLYLFFLWQNRQQWATALRWSLGPIVLLAAALLLWLYNLFGQFSLQDLLTPHRGGFNTGHFDGIVGLWFDQEYGLLPYAPIYLLAVFGVGWLWRAQPRRVEVSFLLLIYTSYHLFGGSYHDWPGGLSPVPRYLIAVLPVLILFTAGGLAWSAERRAWSQPLALALTTIWVTRLILFVRRYWMFGYYAGSNTILRDHYHLDWLINWLPSFWTAPVSEAYLRWALLLTVIILGWGVGALVNRWLFARLPTYTAHPTNPTLVHRGVNK